MKKEGVFDTIFWTGLVISLAFLFFRSIISFIGIVAVLVAVVLIGFQKKLLISLHLFALFMGAVLAVISINPPRVVSYIAGIFVILLSLFSFILTPYMSHIKIKKRVIEKKHEKKKKHFHLTVLLYILSVIILTLSVMLDSMNFLYIGAALISFTFVYALIKLRKEMEKHKEKPKKEKTKQTVRIASMKKYAALKYSQYETDMDKLYRLLQKFKTVKLSEIRGVFNIDNDKAEEWAKILDEHKLAVLYYPSFGEPELRWKQ